MKVKSILALALSATMTLGMMAGCGGTSSNGSASGTDGGSTYPTKDITVIIPKNPGGGTDVSTRGLVQYMQEHLEGSNFIPTNKPDGGGVTGMVETANAKADGYTLGAVTVELAMFPHQGKSTVTYEDFAPICAQIAAPAALIVPADAPYNTLDEFVAYCKENPGTVQMGNSGMGAIWHVATVQMEKEFDISVKHIPYPNGTADIAAALTGGHIDGTLADPSSFVSQVQAGTLKILAIMADERSVMFPDVPTFKELGYDMTIRSWACLVAPKDTPEDVLEILRNAAEETCNDPEYQDYLMKQGIDPVCIIGDDCYQMMKEDHEMFGEVLADLEV